jgi:hypothetical protein
MKVLYIVYVAFVLAGIGSGTGQHMDALTVDQIKIALRVRQQLPRQNTLHLLKLE